MCPEAAAPRGRDLSCDAKAAVEVFGGAAANYNYASRSGGLCGDPQFTETTISVLHSVGTQNPA